MNYQKYLKTAHFTNVRNDALKRWQNRCALCSNPNNLHVHHNNYDCFYNETENDVIVLCENCHKKFHNKEVEYLEILTPSEKHQNFLAELKDIMTLVDNGLPSLLYYKHYPKISKRWGLELDPKKNMERLIEDVEKKFGGNNG